MKKVFVLLLVCPVLLSCEYAHSASPGQMSLLQRADKRELWKTRAWQRLLHYDHGRSQVQPGSPFFLSTNGAQDAASEGEQCLAAFWKQLDADLDTDVLTDTDPRCRFPARYTFLARELGVSEIRDVAGECPALQHWLAAVKGSGISLVFPVSYLNNPASMFGHTLLRIDSEAFPLGDPLLAASVGFAAAAGTERGPGYALRGLLGLFTGFFTTAPYYQQASMYGHVEDRDIWEYSLELSREEVTFLLLHLWELRGIGIPYFFLRRNCAFQVLSLLEAVRPELGCTDAFHLWTLPVETIRRIEKKIGYRSPPVYRPSLSTRVSRAAQPLTELESELGYSLASNSASLSAPAFTRLAEGTRSCVLRLAMLYNQYLQEKYPERSGALTQVLHALTTSRSTLPKCTVLPWSGQSPLRPDHGHPAMRLRVGAGQQEGQPFLSLGFRPLLHDRFDPAPGYKPGVNLEVFDIEMRYWTDCEQLSLESLDLIALESVVPHNPLPSQPAWYGRLGIGKYSLAGDDRDLVLEGAAGAGRAVSFGANGYGYVLAGGRFLVSDQIGDRITVGPAIRLGGMMSSADTNWLWGVETDFFWSLDHDDGATLRTACSGSYRLSSEQAIGFELSLNKDFGASLSHTALLRWCWYFD